MSDANPIVVSHLYPTQSKIVWRAITDPEWMRQWYFAAIEDFRPQVGFETEFVVHCEGVDFPHHWSVTEVTPGVHIRYRWTYPGIDGISFVDWALKSEGDSVRLTLTHSGHESFASDRPEFSRESCEGGWQYFLGKALPDFLQSLASQNQTPKNQASQGPDG